MPGSWARVVLAHRVMPGFWARIVLARSGLGPILELALCGSLHRGLRALNERVLVSIFSRSTHATPTFLHKLQRVNHGSSACNVRAVAPVCDADQALAASPIAWRLGVSATRARA